MLGALVIAACLLAAGRPAAAVTQLPGFHSAYAGQDPWPVIAVGTTTTYSVRFKNTGTETWLRGVANVEKRYTIQVAAYNLGLVMRHRFGAGTPRQAAAVACFTLKGYNVAVIIHLRLSCRQASCREQRLELHWLCLVALWHAQSKI